MKKFSNEEIKIVDVVVTTVICNDWNAEDVKVTVVDLFRELVLSRNQSRHKHHVNQTQCSIKLQAPNDFPDLISCIGKSRKHTVESTFHKMLTITHQKGRHVSINLQVFLIKLNFRNL